MTTRVGVLDDHRSYGEALCLALSVADGFDCVGVVTTISDACGLVKKMQPSVLMVDYQLADEDGLVGARRIRRAAPNVRIIMLTAYASPDLKDRALTVGIEQLLTKDSPLRTILDAIENGRPVPSEQSSPEVTLTKRQREVLTLMGEGLDPATIAETLEVSIHTARSYVKGIMKALGAPTQLAAVTAAIRGGYLMPPRLDRHAP